MNAHVSQGGWPVLVLNADFRPLSYYPLSLWSWQDAIKAVFLDRVNIVHNIATDSDGWVYVADRENHRVQVFDGNGKYETQWNNLHRPCALHCCGGKTPNFIVGELGPGMPVNLKAPNLGPRLTIVDAKGKRIARLGGENGPGLEAGKFLAPHGLALDSKGDIYVGEVGVTNWKTSFPDTPMPPEVRMSRCLQKLERIQG